MVQLLCWSFEEKEKLYQEDASGSLMFFYSSSEDHKAIFVSLEYLFWTQRKIPDFKLEIIQTSYSGL